MDFSIMGYSSQDAVHDPPSYIGQSEIAALEVVGQLGVVDPKQVQHGGVKIVDRHAILDGVIAKFIGLSVPVATLYPGPKKNLIFNAATIWWPQGLSNPPGHILPWSHYSRPHGPDSRVQQITRNIFAQTLQ